MTWLRLLRAVFLMAMLCSCVWGLCLNGNWSGRLTAANGTWIIQLPSSPVWAAPARPDYESFRRTFAVRLPAPETAGFSISRRLEFGAMVGNTLVLVWPICVMTGWLYVEARGKRRDRVLQVALWIGIGQTLAAVVSVVLWLIVGGWGPPLAGELALFGMAAGFVQGIRSYRGPLCLESRRPCGRAPR